MFNVSVGYRFMDWLGVYYEQDLGGLIWDNGPAKDWKIFSGASLVSIRGFLAISSIELWGKLGLGCTYIADSDSDADEAWFAFRLGIGATYMFSSTVGAGLDFSYTLGAGDDNAHIDDVIHFVSLKAHISFRF